MEVTLYILLIALVADWYWGEPNFLWSRVPHPVVLFGNAIGYIDKKFNLESDGDNLRYRKGAISISILIIASILVGLVGQFLMAKIGLIGSAIEVVIVFTLLAQRSLLDHVSAVVTGLRSNGLDGGRAAVAMIVGRDLDTLDQSSISRASIESLAENFSDGLVAPAFWYAIFGLPGLMAYKMINTADSMIGYHNERYEHFGKVTAKIDDGVNWLPARIAAALIASGALFVGAKGSGKNSALIALRDAGLHQSPNAGWPEAAMAGATGFALGGPRIYKNETVQQSYLNASGKLELDAADIEVAITFAQAAFFVGVSIVAFLALVFG